MWRSLFNVSWRLLLAISLAVGPWPPAAWAAIALKSSVAPMTDCHGSAAADSIPTQHGTPCEDDCCAAPACDPAHCLVLHAAIAPLPPPLRGAVLIPHAVPGWLARAPSDPPPPTLLRPPIA
jgi:hypothetical protein